MGPPDRSTMPGRASPSQRRCPHYNDRPWDSFRPTHRRYALSLANANWNRSTVRALTVDRRTRCPSYSTVSETKGVTLPRPGSNEIEDTRGSGGEAPGSILVRKRGLEPPRPCGRQPLKLVRLPIP